MAIGVEHEAERKTNNVSRAEALTKSESVGTLRFRMYNDSAQSPPA